MREKNGTRARVQPVAGRARGAAAARRRQQREPVAHERGAAPPLRAPQGLQAQPTRVQRQPRDQGPHRRAQRHAGQRARLAQRARQPPRDALLAALLLGGQRGGRVLGRLLLRGQPARAAVLVALAALAPVALSEVRRALSMSEPTPVPYSQLQRR